MKDNLKVQTDKVEDLNKQLLEVKKYKETAEFKYLELETTIAGLIQDVEQAQKLNENVNSLYLSLTIILVKLT